MKTLPTYVLALAMLLILGVGSRFAQAARPVLPPAQGSVAQRTSHLTNYLARTLHLSQPQQKQVAQSTRKYLQQLELVAVKPGLVAASTPERLLTGQTAAEAEKEYTLALARILTPGQYTAYSWLREHQPEESR
ncbi:hypothetical protein K3G63_13590 [Hymenobacter sp. HSC-4F20]|uniref:hypothetical protein n=1 Tax=Hymenobacter sp. HSC-4F20 TaxID=2864135 RepID=UPI001C72A46D|nr:hypothetical protein [Hymenobacter sp. HSC-4F20]MBX0291477.1 hypothetical protein [Hymenobacter sp. HSC-4F20]